MRARPVVILCVLAGLGSCTLPGWLQFGDDQTAPVPATYPIPDPVSSDWVLVRPPDDGAATRLIATLERLPGPGGRFPGASDAVPAAGPGATLALFEALRAAPSPRAQARLLAERTVDEAAPPDSWTRVRRFSSRQRCEETRRALREVTKEESAKIAYRQGMLMDDLQFALLAESFAWSRCVPADRAVPAAAAEG